MITFQIYWNLVIAISMWCVGFYTITRKGKIFYSISQWLERTKKKESGNPNDELLEYIIPSYIANPIVSCIYCMASFHGVLFYLGYLLFTGMHFLDWHNLIIIPICVSASPLNGIIWGLVKLLSGGKISDD